MSISIYGRHFKINHQIVNALQFMTLFKPCLFHQPFLITQHEMLIADMMQLINPGNFRQRIVRSVHNYEMLLVHLGLINHKSYRNSRYIGRKSLEVVEGGGGVPHDEVDRDEETAQDDTERATDHCQENILLEEDTIPRFSATRMCNISWSLYQTYN